MENQTEQNDIFECTDCGAEVSNNAEVCPNCGANFNVKVSPWARWFARVIDYQWAGLLLGIMFLIIAPEIFLLKFIYLNMIATFLYVFIESSLLVMWGTTPGKYLLNIKLVPVKSQTITFDMALKRSFLVWVQGVGLGFPLATVILTFIWLGKLPKDKITSWDKASKINVIHNEISNVRLIVIAIVFIAILLLNAYLTIIGE